MKLSFLYMKFCEKHEKYITYLDFFHDATNIPLLKTSTKSKFGIIITVLFSFYFIIYLTFEIINYNNNYNLSYSENFITNSDVEQKITFGFRIDQKWIDKININIFDSYNKIIDKNLIKICDENLNEIQDDKISQNNYICFINYQTKGSNISNHILKIRLIYENKTMSYFDQSERLALYAKFKEPKISHNNYDPFDFSNELYEFKYFYSFNFSTSYRNI